MFFFHFLFRALGLGFAFAQPVADVLTTVIAAALFVSLFRHLREEEALTAKDPKKGESAK